MDFFEKMGEFIQSMPEPRPDYAEEIASSIAFAKSDDSPYDVTHKELKRIADATTEQASSKKDEVEILREQLELNKRIAEEAKADALIARRDARFAKITTVISIVLSVIATIAAFTT
ncbi:MAG: hypothetical protein IJM99_10120 [Firmicutes bacterium]|nr:hypothetical protein [Bacillota bacterium]